ncbi:hypothetical protein CBS101457_004346 [Exobasidium rhododendri]|nr:hypothetical protein CBS101457_004346 [Exobasidium rhododendri]
MGKNIPTWKRRRRQSRSSSASLLLVICTIFLLASSSLVAGSIFNVGGKKFSYEGLINAGSMGLENLDGHVAAFGDFNGDSAMDLFVINGDATKASVYLWDRDSFSFQFSPASQITIPSGRKIVNIIPADFTYNGKLDLLIMMKSSNSAVVEMIVWQGSISGGYLPEVLTIPSSSSAQPFVLDATGDMHADLLGHVSSSSGKLSLWKNTFGQNNRTDLFELADAPFTPQASVPTCQLAEPHSSAFIDFNGDCLADLFLVCVERKRLIYQIWTGDKGGNLSEATYTFARSGVLPPGTGALSFADMDRDGTIDVVFPSCSGSECFINIAYNRQIPLCSEKRSGWFGVGPGEDPKSGKEGRGCRDPESNLCVADDQFNFDFTISDVNELLTRIPIGSITPEKKLLITDDLLSQSVPIPLSLGDHNKDGYPDMAIITVPSAGKRDETRLRLLKSVACNAKGAALPGCPTDLAKRAGKRTFEMMKDGTGAIDDLQYVRSVSFFDMAEDGSLDLMLQQLPTSGRVKDKRQITFIQNNFFYDAFMLKVMTSNGACSSYCEVGPDNGKRYKPWGVNYGGASYKFTVLDTNGVRRAQQVGQLAQTAYRSLLTPYSYFGLGRTNNYVESLFIGTTKRREANFIEMEGVIPNSQVIVLPFEEQGGDVQGDGSTWKKELYLSPGDWIAWVMVVLITIIIILLGFVFVLHLNEKREDEKERKRAVHAINFDAL